MADEENHIHKNKFTVPFVCGCRNLGEALRRIAEGAAMLRTKGEAGTGNVVEAVRHARAVQRDIRRLTTLDEDELFVAAKVRSCFSFRSIILIHLDFNTRRALLPHYLFFFSSFYWSLLSFLYIHFVHMCQ